MSLVLEFLPEAFAEVERATGDYEAASAGLGVRFRRELESACAGIVQHPRLWRMRPGGFRRVNLPGFPDYIAFIADEKVAPVVAVAHSARRPGYFRNRMP